MNKKQIGTSFNNGCDLNDIIDVTFLNISIILYIYKL